MKTPKPPTNLELIAGIAREQAKRRASLGAFKFKKSGSANAAEKRKGK
jgi:hypothetical protein